jgi:3-oxoacyl-[acyl-carrier protein] reductase
MSGAGERVLVVGATSAIGAAVANRFRAAGARVDCTYHAMAPVAGVASGWHRLDVADAGSRAALAEGLAAGGGLLDVVVVVAGLLPGKALAEYPPGLAEQVMQVNALGPMLLVQALLPLLADQSRVVLFSSVSGERGSFDPVYASAKAALVGFVKSMATWCAPRTRFVAVAPGLVEGTAMYQAMAPERREHHRAATPIGYLAAPADLAAIVHDLTLPHWAHANGTCVRFNGGAYA